MKTKIYGKYQTQKLIGEGSFGKVYLASFKNEKFALKCIPKKTRTLNEIRNLKSQTQLLKKVNHANIIGMKECFETPEQLIVVMQYAGDDLSRLLEKQRKLPEEKVREYGRQIIEAMNYLHQNRILHRDLKPQNILLNEGVIKICDFGFAKKMSASTNFLRSIKGTPLYIAPEILQSKPYTFKVDVWSLGIILYELAYGKTPFHAHTIQQLQPKILHQSVKYPKDMSPLLKELIDGMLQKSDVKRFDWQQVKNHKFFNETVIKPSILGGIGLKQQIKQLRKEQIRWDAEQQSGYILKIDRQILDNKIELKDLKYNQQFSLRVIRLFGEICLQRTKISKQVLIKTIRIITNISKIKPQGKDQDNDITKNKTLITAIITLAFDQNDQDLLPDQLELVGYLLKQNFDGIKIDTEHDDQITTLISRKLSNPQFSRKSINFCFKVLGILASQAITTLSNSQQFFQRMADEKVLSLVAQLYSPQPEHAIALQVIQKFIHPKFQCNINISHRIKLLFRGFKEQITPILIKKCFIGQQSPIHKKWKKNSDLQIYCGVLWQLLNQSAQLRNQYGKRNYWKDLVTKRQTKLYFLAMTYSMLKGSGIFQLTPQFIQNQIIVESSQNKLTHVFLLYFAQHIMIQHQNAASIREKKKRSIQNIRNLLQTEDSIKRKSCRQLLGFFAEGSKFFNKILIDILFKLMKDSKQQQLINDTKTIINEAVMLSLSQQSLLQLLQLSQKHNFQYPAAQLKRLDELFLQMLKKDVFEDYLSVNAPNCSKLLRYLLQIQNGKTKDEKQIIYLTQIIQQYNLHRLFFSQQILNQDLLIVVLKIVNKSIGKFKIIDIIASLGIQAIKKYFKTNLQNLRIEIMIFASHLAKFKHQYCHQLIISGIVSLCFKSLGENDEVLKEKTLHLIGNLSKHDDKAFDEFHRYNILSLTHKCISQNKSNKRILKNTIYAIGNISYYGQKFATQIKPTIKYLADGLLMQDQHLLLNTISTISNLLRHGPIHLQALIDNGIFDKIFQIYAKTMVMDHINYISNMLRKAIKYNQFYKFYPRDTLKNVIEINLKKGKGDSIHVIKLRNEVFE